MKSKIRNHLTYDVASSVSTRVWKPSLTVPDMVLSLRELIARYTRGLAIPRVPLVNIPIDVSMYDKLDSFQRIDAARQQAVRVQMLTESLNAKKAAQAKLRAELEFENAVKAKADSLVSAKTTLNEKA